MKFRKGFTLIELLVVIAIIGLLSSVVLAALNSARSKGSDAAVKGDFAQIRSQAELYYSNNSRYNTAGAPTTALWSQGSAGAVCGATTGMYSDTNITAALAHIAANMDNTSVMKCTTSPNGDKWALSVTKLKGSQASWCVDNSGWAKAGSAVGTDAATATGMCI